jgi:hypothetical protein
MTGYGYRCRGHREASDYTSEPIPLTPEQQEERAAEAERKEAERIAKWEAGRWFRPIEADLPNVEIGPFWGGVSDVVLKALFSMVGEGITVGMATEPALVVLWELGHQAAAEVQRRGLDWPEGYYDLTLAPEWDSFRPIMIGDRGHAYYNPFPPEELVLPHDTLSDDHLLALLGCAGQVEDYSCLERGARQLSGHIYNVLGAEQKRRGIPFEWLMDWED